MSESTNFAAQERLGQLINDGNIDALDEVFHAEVVDHDPAPGQGPGPQGFKDFFTTMRAAFPDLTIKPATVVAADDHVSLAYTLTGTYQGASTGWHPLARRSKRVGHRLAGSKTARSSNVGAVRTSSASWLSSAPNPNQAETTRNHQVTARADSRHNTER